MYTKETEKEHIDYLERENKRLEESKKQLRAMLSAQKMINKTLTLLNKISS